MICALRVTRKGTSVNVPDSDPCRIAMRTNPLASPCCCIISSSPCLISYPAYLLTSDDSPPSCTRSHTQRRPGVKRFDDVSHLLLSLKQLYPQQTAVLQDAPRPALPSMREEQSLQSCSGACDCDHQAQPTLLVGLHCHLTFVVTEEGK